MFPYLDTAGWRLQPFGFLIALGLGIGFVIGSRRAERQGVPKERMAELALLAIGAGLVAGHFLQYLTAPAGAIHSPSALFTVWRGQSSFGSFAGAVIGALIFFKRQRIPVAEWLIYFDAGAFAAPFTWAIVRIGCYLVHDHAGLRTSSWLAVKYPGGPRYDLALLEWLLLLILIAAFLWLDRQPRPRGFFCAAFLFGYAAIRLAIDPARVDPPHYAGMTLDQIAAIVMVVAGIATVMQMLRLRRANLG